jgi:hypothetical protein
MKHTTPRLQRLVRTSPAAGGFSEIDVASPLLACKVGVVVQKGNPAERYLKAENLRFEEINSAISSPDCLHRFVRQTFAALSPARSQYFSTPSILSLPIPRYLTPIPTPGISARQMEEHSSSPGGSQVSSRSNVKRICCRHFNFRIPIRLIPQTCQLLVSSRAFLSPISQTPIQQSLNPGSISPRKRKYHSSLPGPSGLRVPL